MKLRVQGTLYLFLKLTQAEKYQELGNYSHIHVYSIEPVGLSLMHPFSSASTVKITFLGVISNSGSTNVVRNTDVTKTSIIVDFLPTTPWKEF